MMNAEEEDVDLDLTNEDANNETSDDGACLLPAAANPLPDESPVSSPVAPIYYQNLINDEAGRNTDDDMKKFDSLSSDSSVSEPTVKRTPYGVQVSKRAAAAGIFNLKNEQKGECSVLSGDQKNPSTNPPVPEQVPAQVAVETPPAPPTMMNGTPALVADNAASRSAVKCLFPDDKANDDFLTTPLNNTLPGPIPSAEPLPSPMTALSNDFNQSCTIQDDKPLLQSTQNVLNTGSATGLQTTATPLLHSDPPSQTSPGTSAHPQTSPLKPSVLAQSLPQLQPSTLMQPAQPISNQVIQPAKEAEINEPTLNGSPFVPSNVNIVGSDNSYDYRTSYTNDHFDPTNSLPRNSSYQPYNSANNSTATTPSQSGEHPILYNPSSFPASDIVGGNLQSNMSSQPVNINKPATLSSSQNRVTNYHANLQFANPMSNEVDNTNKSDDSPLFIPQMYNSAQSASSASAFFIPQPIVESNTVSHLNSPQPNGGPGQDLTSYAQPLNPPPHSFPTDPYGGSHISAPPSYNDCIMPDNNAMYDISPLGHKHGKENGFLSWFKGASSWTSSANTLKQYMKTATDSVLTTLDPGMKEYLSPGVHLHTCQSSSEDVPVIVGLKEGFRCALHSEPTIQTHMMPNINTALLPIGFEGGMQGITEQLDYLKSCVQNDATWGHVVIASQVFVTELVAGKWFVMYCFGLEDVSKDILLHTFSQPIPLPLGCMTSAYQYIQYNAQGDCMGYNRSVHDIVRSQLQIERDWCLALTGTPLQQVMMTAIQCIAYDYQRHSASVSTGPPPPQQTADNYHHYQDTTNHYPQQQQQQQQQQQPPPPPLQLQYGLSIDAIS